LVVRFRRARGVERQQIKWFAFSGVVFCAVFAAGPFLWMIPQSPATAWIWPVLFLAGASTVPAAVGIAILRYRLYDVDLIINRAIVYAVLTATLVLVYVGSVLSLQYLFRGLIGQESSWRSSPPPSRSPPCSTRCAAECKSPWTDASTACGPTLLPQEVRRRQDPGRLQRPAARGDAAGRPERGPGWGGHEDRAAGPRLAVASPRNGCQGRAGGLDGRLYSPYVLEG
jgi:hypothetical protein